MGMLEIILLAAGAILFALSFFLPSKSGASGLEPDAAREEIKALVAGEMDGIKTHVEDVVDESISYAVEKTERALERLTNEKILAVNEYSDTVLNEIHKNHEEALFLYDMLNSKHNSLKDTVSQVNKTVKEAEETAREMEAAVAELHREEPSDTAAAGLAESVGTEAVTASAETGHMDTSFMQDGEAYGCNNNEQILELYRQGKSKVSIAQELGLGVGEVKLVIDLYENR